VRARCAACDGKKAVVDVTSSLQNYGYHGCGERGKQKDMSPFQCGIKSEIAGRLVLCAVGSKTKTAGDDRIRDRCPPGLQW
jgi:hypothetical protein